MIDKERKRHKTGYNFPNRCFVRINGGPIIRMDKEQAHARNDVTFVRRKDSHNPS